VLTVEQALQQMLEAARPIGETETVATPQAIGRVLASDVVSGIDVPPLDNAQMDGYALRRADLARLPARLPVALRVTAGQAPGQLPPGAAARIFTGAPIPAGADTVIMQEEARLVEGQLVLEQAPEAGQWIRRAGCDIARGSVALPAGLGLRAQHLGVAASVGAAALTVVRRPRVAVFCTGDELAMPGEPIGPGQIYNSNRYLLAGLLETLGCEVRDHGIVPDNFAATRAALERAAREADLVLSSGGVSVGEEDHVRAALQSLGQLQLWQIAMKPGKPLAFGQLQGVPFIGLPGNPVSGFVTFVLTVRPFLLRRLGVREVAPHGFQVRADFRYRGDPQRREFLRARINADGGVELAGSQNAAVLSTVAWAHGLVDLPAGTPVEPGQIVRFLSLAELAGPA
jgi:molybdopterin molybdotransferase